MSRAGGQETWDRRPGGKGKDGKDGKRGDGPVGGKRGQKGGSKGEGKGGKGGLGDRKKHVFKALCSDPLAANIIGHAGETRKRIEEETGCNVWISKRDEFFPQSQCRLLLLHADTPTQVMAALEQTIFRLAEVADKDREDNLEVETPLLGKEVGEYIYRMALPSLIRGKLIGTGGAHIRQLRDETGAKIFVDNEVYSGHHFARVIGPKEVILKTLTIINDLVQEEVDSPDYEPWASVQWFDPGAGGGKGGKDKDDRREIIPRGGGRSPPRGGGKGGRDQQQSRRERSRSRRRRSPEPRDAPPSRSDPPDSSPVEALDRLSREFPPGALGMDHAVSCDLPASAVGPLMGDRDDYKLHIERQTGTIITVDKSMGPEHLTIMITGPLIWVYAAHCMVMKRYHEMERAAEDRRRGPSATDTGSRVEELQAQLIELQSQLAEVQRSRAGGGGGAPRGARR